MSDEENGIEVSEERTQSEGVVPGTAGGEIVSGLVSIMDGFKYKTRPILAEASDRIDHSIGSINNSNAYAESRKLANEIGQAIWLPRFEGDKCPDGILNAAAALIRIYAMDF